MYMLICRFVLILALSGWAFNLQAHESRPYYIEITETAENVFKVLQKVPPTVDAGNQPELLFSQSCTSQKTAKAQIAQCSKTLAGQSLIISYPKYFPSVSTMIRYKNLAGEQHTALLTPEEKSWVVPDAETTSATARQYTLLGIKHILAGWDHLLFLACLLLIARTGRRVLITITGFTLAHSVTLALSALKLVSVPVPPVEAVIALSVVFLATEIARDRHDTLTWRYPIAVSTSFGLLHGFGFAAVLGEIGLPQSELVAGLLFFNVGVELGQIAFVLAVLLAIRGLLLLSMDIRKPLFEKHLAYGVGCLAAFWFVERVAGFW